jgi:hypothetical protein
MSNLKKINSRFRARRKLSKDVEEELDRGNLLKTATIISPEDLLRDTTVTTRSRRRRLVDENQKTPEVALNVRTMAACFRELRRGVPSACYNRLRAELRSLDMIFTLGRDELIPSPAFDQYIKQKLEPLQDAALLTYLALGVVVVRFIRNPLNDEVYPQVPQWGTYNITIQVVLGQPVLRFYWTTLPTWDGDDCVSGGNYRREHEAFNVGSQGQIVTRGVRRSDGTCQSVLGSIGAGGFGHRDDSVAIIANLGHDPDYDGTINSVMSSVLADYITYNNHMRAHAIRAGARLANPPIATEYNAALDQVMSKNSTDIGHFVGSGVIAPGAEGTAQRRSELYERTREQQAVQREQYRVVRDTMGAAGLEQYGLSVDESCGREFVESTLTFNDDMGTDEIKIRDDRKLSTAFHEPKFRTDTVAAMSENNEAIAIAFGLTMAILKGETTAAKSGTELSTKTVNSTLRALIQTMSAVQTLVYDHIFGTQDIFDLLSDQVRLAPGEALYEPNSLFVNKAEALSARVSYRFTPLMTLESLRFVKARGIIDFAKYATSAVQTLGMAASDVASLKDPLDEETGRALDVPEYVQIMQLKSAEKIKDKELKSASSMKDKDIENSNVIKDKEISSAKDLAAMKPERSGEPAKKKKKKSE